MTWCRRCLLVLFALAGSARAAAEGPFLVADVATQPASFGGLEDAAAYGLERATVGDVLYVSAQDPAHGRELWRSDGTHGREIWAIRRGELR